MILCKLSTIVYKKNMLGGFVKMADFALLNHKFRIKHSAFTLAEVLITIGIIGIVAAITIPTLMTKYSKKRTETQLKAFYSKINQTLKMSAAENGDIDGLITPKTYSYDEQVEFLKQYIFPYMKTLGYEECSPSGQIHVCIDLIDGGLMTFSVNIDGGDIQYFPSADVGRKNMIEKRPLKKPTREIFAFQFAKYNNIKRKEIKSTNFIEPYVFMWDGTKEGLKKDTWTCVKGRTNCGYCTKMIQMNDWRIPDDYPW